MSQFDPFVVAERARKAAGGKGPGTAGGEPPSGPPPVIMVELPSGVDFPVLTEEEAAYLRAKVEAYKTQYEYSNVSDLAELDRCISLELQAHRMGLWLAQRRDYEGKLFDENAMRQRLKETSAETRQVKKTLGIDGVARERTRGKGSVAEFIQRTLDNAKQFGLMRNEQMAKSIELANELIAIVDRRKNAVNDKEIRKLRVTDDDIIEWIDTVFRDEFTAIDAAFRAGKQRLWELSQ